MSKRLQVLLPEAEMRRLRKLARTKGVTVAAWVREAIGRAAREQPDDDVAKRLQAFRAAVRAAEGLNIPAPDIKTMLAEIERGRGL